MMLGFGVSVRDSVFDFSDQLIHCRPRERTRDEDMREAKRDWNAPPTRDLNIWLCGR